MESLISILNSRSSAKQVQLVQPGFPTHSPCCKSSQIHETNWNFIPRVLFSLSQLLYIGFSHHLNAQSWRGYIVMGVSFKVSKTGTRFRPKPHIQPEAASVDGVSENSRASAASKNEFSTRESEVSEELSQFLFEKLLEKWILKTREIFGFVKVYDFVIILTLLFVG